MNRIIKILGIVVGVVVLLFVALVVVVSLMFDPNDYKADITAAVQEATGRELTLDGDLELSLFPTIRIAVGAATLSNAQGFGDEPMARIGGASLSVRLLPLLSKRVEIREARLEGLTLNLARDQRGRNNWQDLAGESAPVGEAPAAEPSDGGAGTLDLGVGAIEIADANIVWNDASTGSRWELTDFGLRAEDFGPGRRFPLSMDFSLAGADVAVKVASEMQATLAIASGEYRLDAACRHDRRQRCGLAGWPEPGDAEVRLAGRESRRGDAGPRRAHARLLGPHDGRLAVGSAAPEQPGA